MNPEDEIDVPDDMTHLTLDTLGLCGFGYRFNCFYGTHQHPFVTAMVDALTTATERQAGAWGARCAFPGRRSINFKIKVRSRTRLDFALVPAMAATTSGQDAHHGL